MKILSLNHRNEAMRLRVIFQEKLTLLDPLILVEFPITTYVKILDSIEQRNGYFYVDVDIVDICTLISDRIGVAGLDIYHRLLLLDLILDFDNRTRYRKFTKSIEPLIELEFDRIIASVEQIEEGFFLNNNDLFLKDLGICRLKLLPCGPEVVDTWSDIPRRILIQGGIKQFFNVSTFFIRLGGFKPYFDSHWDRRYIRQFNAENYERCYLRIAELLLEYPAVKGLCGGSWWFDPELIRISPEFEFLSKTPLEHGARLFRAGSDDNVVRDALSFSKKRKDLFNAGQYTPWRYLLVWGRDDLITWANKNPLS